jgi:hypothetical protein
MKELAYTHRLTDVYITSPFSSAILTLISITTPGRHQARRTEAPLLSARPVQHLATTLRMVMTE